MGIAEFDRIDIAARQADGTQTLITVAGNGYDEDEALATTLTLIKISLILQYADQLREGGQRIALELVSYGELPAPLLAWLNARGVSVSVAGPGQERAPAKGRPTSLPWKGEDPDWTGLMELNAAACARIHGLPFPATLADVDAVDAPLEAWRTESGLGPEDELEEAQDGTLQVLTGAWAGEILRSQLPGVWRHDKAVMPLPHLYVAGLSVNPLGKARKYLANGSSDSLASLVRAALHHARAAQA